MTASASAWQPAISYSLTGALVLLVVTLSTPSDSAVHQTPPSDVCVYMEIYSSLGLVSLFKHGKM